MARNPNQYLKGTMMNKTLIVGYKGGIGKRYQAVFDYLNLSWVGVDIGDEWPDPCTYKQVLICTPTQRHIDDCLRAVAAGKNFLCEKPLSKNPELINALNKACKQSGVRGAMVNNWWWAIKIRFQRKPPISVIDYNFFNTGNDGTAWDCIQPIYLAEVCKIKTESPVFHCFVNGQEMTRFFFDASYVDMIRAWNDGNQLWTLEQAEEATRKVIAYEKLGFSSK